ncbi:MAG: TauD/TfdA family dioxygenase [Gammaproteobacteria bacterium]|nr:TauD/TfdA family dioxygenase [Gammaproteobacteria bacterium]
MITLTTTPLHLHYGVKIHDLQLADIDLHNGYPEVRSKFEEESVLYFPDQQIDDTTHLRVCSFFGPREDRSASNSSPDPLVSTLSNVNDDGGVYGTNESQVLSLRSNMHWHTDSTFMPIPALTNMLIARVVPASGTATQFVSTRIAWREMPDALKARARGCAFRHHYAHSRQKTDREFAQSKTFWQWEAQTWKSIWTNPVNQQEALYIASHVFDVVGMEQHSGHALVEELLDWCTQDRFIYEHQWQPGDVLLWDERATLHRGIPWNYDEPRTLTSVCVSATTADGLDEIRVHDAVSDATYSLPPFDSSTKPADRRSGSVS